MNCIFFQSVFGSIRNYFSSSSKPETTVLKTSNSATDLDSDQLPKSASKSRLTSILEQASTTTSSAKDDIHPTQRLRQEESYSGRQADNLLDRNLDLMGDSLSRLKMLGSNLLDEIEDQNEMVDRIGRKTEDVDFRVTNQTKEMNRILKK